MLPNPGFFFCFIQGKDPFWDLILNTMNFIWKANKIIHQKNTMCKTYMKSLILLKTLLPSQICLIETWSRVGFQLIWYCLAFRYHTFFLSLELNDHFHHESPGNPSYTSRCTQSTKYKVNYHNGPVRGCSYMMTSFVGGAGLPNYDNWWQRVRSYQYQPWP